MLSLQVQEAGLCFLLPTHASAQGVNPFPTCHRAAGSPACTQCASRQMSTEARSPGETLPGITGPAQLLMCRINPLKLSLVLSPPLIQPQQGSWPPAPANSLTVATAWLGAVSAPSPAHISWGGSCFCRNPPAWAVYGSEAPSPPKTHKGRKAELGGVPMEARVPQAYVPSVPLLLLGSALSPPPRRAASSEQRLVSVTGWNWGLMGKTAGAPGIHTCLDFMLL